MYCKIAEIVDLKCSHPQKEMVVMSHNRGMSYGSNHSVRYRCIKSVPCTPYTHTMLYVNYITMNLGERASMETTLLDKG